MATLSTFLEELRYELRDQETGILFDDDELLVYLNRMIRNMDSALIAVDSDLMMAEETGMPCVADQDYIDITNLNNGYWDSIREVWIGNDRLTQISLSSMHYKRQWYEQSGKPYYWALDNNRILFEQRASEAYYPEIYYNRINRPRLSSWNDTFTGEADDDFLTLTSGQPALSTGDGIFQVSNSGGALPTGLTASTNYWLITDPNNVTKVRLATSKPITAAERVYASNSGGYALVNGLNYKIVARTTLDFTSYGAAANTVGTYFTCNATGGTLGSGDAVRLTDSINLTTDGTGTQTITLTEYTPYDGKYDDFLANMLVLYAKSADQGGIDRSSEFWSRAFKKKAFENVVRRNFVFKDYHIDF